MTVAAQTPRDQYTGNGSQTVFSYTFEIVANADIAVYVGKTLQTITTDYTVSGAGSGSGGSVTFLVAPANAAIVTFRRAMSYARTVDFQTAGPAFASDFNADSDRNVLALQQMQEQLNRGIRVGPGSEFTADDLELNLTAAERASSVISFDENGDIGITALPMIAEASLVGEALSIPRVKADESTYELRTPAETRSDIGADDADNLTQGTVDSDRLTGSYTGVTGVGSSSDPSTVTGSTVTLAGTTKVAMTGTGGAVMPSGTTGQRGADAGTVRFNSTTSKLEYTNDGAAYQDIGSVTESTAPEYTASNGLYINSQTIGADVTVPAGHSAMSTGPITIASGVTVTLASGSRWVVL